MSSCLHAGFRRRPEPPTKPFPVPPGLPGQAAARLLTESKSKSDLVGVFDLLFGRTGAGQ